MESPPTEGAVPSRMATSAREIGEEPLENLTERKVRKKLCNGHILLRIRLASTEVTSLKQPPPLFCLEPRLKYLPFLFHDVTEHFEAHSCLPPRFGEAYEIWFDINGVPLKWHYPLGVLCDVLVGSDVPTPLDVTVHFKSTLDSQSALMPFRGISDIQRAFMNSYRQAVYLQHQSARKWQSLRMEMQTKLWDAVSSSANGGAYAETRGDYDILEDSYAEVHQHVSCQNLASIKAIPVRLHIYAPPLPTAPQQPRHEVLLHPVLVFDGRDGRLCTLRGFLAEVMPPVLDNGVLREGVDVLTHGLRVPLDTPIYWLALHAAYLDQFVHLAARVPSHLFDASVAQGSEDADVSRRNTDESVTLKSET